VHTLRTAAVHNFKLLNICQALLLETINYLQHKGQSGWTGSTEDPS
jgi:hypothetical protein